MRNIITLSLISVFLLVFSSGCRSTYKQATATADQVYIGMPISEFRELTGKKASIEAMESGYTVFKMNDFNAWTGSRTETKFFYFDSEGKLYKIDSGEFKESRYEVE